MAGARRWFRKDPELRGKLDDLLREIKQEFGIRARVAAGFGRFWVYRLLKAEERRLQNGFILEPPTFRESSLDAVSA